jgi:hypothetical protein
MKKINFKSNGYGTLKLMTVLLAYLLCASACKQNVDPQHEDLKNGAGASNKTSSITSEQELPGGKERFTWVNGNFDTNGYTWERIVQLSFTAATGAVGATVWTWKSPEKKDKVIFNSHLCTVAGITHTLNTHTPYGWMTPSGQYESWTGSYVYNTATDVLSITWATPSFAAGSTESWKITNPTTALARASLQSSSYSLTHGRGYGSKSLFTTFKSIADMINDGLPNYTSMYSKSIYAKADSETAIPTIIPSGFNTWSTGTAQLNLSVFNTPSSPSPANTLHYYQTVTSACPVYPKCRTSRDGIVYHLASNNNGRSMAYSFWCACLPKADEFPTYTGAMHPSALQQILDDNNNLVALLGVEVQNPANTSGYDYHGTYLYQLLDFNNIP